MVTATSTWRRLASAIPTALAASLLVFVLIWVGPNPAQSMMQDGDIDAQAAHQLTSQYGLDQPWHTQYVSWLRNFISGDWGVSMRTHESAAALITERLGVTLALSLAAICLSILVSLPLAMLMANRPRSRTDTSLTASAVLVSAVPAFLLALLLQYGAVLLKDITGITIFHASGGARSGGVIELLQRYTLPVITLTAVQVAGWMRYQRGLLLDVLGSDFITAARARGASERGIQLHHVLRVALVPIVTMVAIDIGMMIGGTLIVETVFGLPGTGRLLLDSVQAHDTVVALDLVMLGAIAIVLANVLSDALCDRIDPRRRRS